MFRKVVGPLLVIFLATRLVILGITFAAADEFYLEKSKESCWAKNKRSWSHFDVGWYKKVAVEGYEEEPFCSNQMKNWAFMPLYPMIMRGLLWVTQGQFFFSMGSFFSSLCTLIALYLFSQVYKLQSIERFFFFYLASAGSFYFSIPYNEGLALLMMALTWFLVKKERFLAASLFAGIGAITRVQLLALIAIPLIPLLLQKKIRTSLLSFLCYSFPLLLYFLYMRHLSGNGAAYFSQQCAWGNTNPYPFSSFVGFIQTGSGNNLCQWIHLLVWGGFLFVWIRNYKKISLAETLFCLGVFMISTACEKFYGAYRYVLLLTPLYVAFANEKEPVRNAFVYSNLILGTMYIIAFVNDRYFVI
jgi:hypothetical protein